MKKSSTDLYDVTKKSNPEKKLGDKIGPATGKKEKMETESSDLAHSNNHYDREDQHPAHNDRSDIDEYQAGPLKQ